MSSHTAFYYGSISLFTTILHNVFLLYHIDMFVSVFKIDKTSFWVGETIFLIWNSVNDPLFGWIGDRNQMESAPAHTKDSHDGSNEDRARRRTFSLVSGDADHASTNGRSGEVAPRLIIGRTRIIGLCGPLMAISFALIWFNWFIPAVQFTVCLCLYDAFLTMVDLHQSALLADLSITANDRAHMNSYESIFSAAGSASVFISYIFWDKTNLAHFKIFCIVLAVISAIGFYTMSAMLRSSYIKSRGASRISDLLVDGNQPVPISQGQRKSMKQFLRQLLTHKNFLMFTIINILQVFHCHFNSNFFPLFMEVLVEDHKHYGSFLIGISFVVPHLNNLVFLRLCKYYGLYNVIKVLFAMKLFLAVAMWNFGLSYGWIMCFFIASNRVFTEGTCKLLTLVISDLVDEDYVRNNRAQPISALIFGMANFLAKPGQTLAPIIGTSLISFMTGHDVFAESSDIKLGRIPQGKDGLIYKDACFKILLYIPLVCGALQIFVWSFFKLHGTQLQRIKNIRSNLQQILLTV